MKKIVFSLIIFLLISVETNAQFCNKYADKAVKQYQLAKKNNLPDINWPLWTDDWNGHFNWCKSVSQDVANKETAKRQAYLDQYIKPQSKEDFCNAYADTAIKQFNQAVQLHLPNMIPTQWNNNKNLHFKWCMVVPKKTASLENTKRQQLIDDFIKSNQGNTKQDSKKETNYKFIKMKVVEPLDLVTVLKLKENICENFAKQAVQQLKLNMSKRCGLKNSFWHLDYNIGGLDSIKINKYNNYDTHLKWCMRKKDYFEVTKILKERNKQLQACRGIHTIWVPGMVLGLRHMINQSNDRFFPSTNYFSHDGNTTSNYKDKISRAQLIDAAKYNDIMNRWKFFYSKEGDYPKAYQYLLPPGIVINLRDYKEARYLVEFGIDKKIGWRYYDYWGSFFGPEYYGEGKFHREFGGDLGSPADEGLSWYESTGLGFHDWSQVSNLPRGTIVGLKHSINQPDKKLIWNGHIYDPADPNIKPPPGFARKVGGDRISRSNIGPYAIEGYFWYEKITGK